MLQDKNPAPEEITALKYIVGALTLISGAFALCLNQNKNLENRVANLEVRQITLIQAYSNLASQAYPQTQTKTSTNSIVTNNPLISNLIPKAIEAINHAYELNAKQSRQTR